MQYDMEPLKPLTLADFPAKTTQLHVDAINALENRVKMSDFSPDYQQEIRNLYRFTPIDIGGANGVAGGGRTSWK